MISIQSINHKLKKIKPIPEKKKKTIIELMNITITSTKQEIQDLSQHILNLEKKSLNTSYNLERN